KRIDGDAVPAEAGAGVEGLEAEGFGFGGFDDFPDVDAHVGEDDFEFVDQGDVDAAVDVFEEFGGFGDFGGGDAMDLRDDARVEGHGEIGGEVIDAADEFGDGGGGGVLAAWVFALGGVSEEEVAAAGEAC